MAIAIVGHGESLVGAKKGAEIDSHTVVRMKNCSRLLKNSEDWGKKTHYLCSSTEVANGASFSVKFKCESWAWPKRGEYDKTRISNSIKVYGDRFIIFSDLWEEWNGRFREMTDRHPNFSIGLAAIIICCDHLKEKDIKLYGFDTLLNPDLKYYTALKERHGHPGHDWETEHKLLQIVKSHYGATIESGYDIL